jgi:hypothetical protein
MYYQIALPYNIKIDNLLKNRELFEPLSASDSFWLGYYYLIHNENPILMNFHFTAASEQGIIHANICLAGYYCASGYNKLGLAYYKEAAQYGHYVAAHNLGWIYYKNGNFKKMKKFYIIAIQNKNVRSMNDLGWHYYEQKQFIKMKKYYLMACDNGFEISFNNLVLYYNVYNKSFGLLKLYVKYHEKYNKRKELIDQFNSVSSEQLSPKQELKFLEITSNFIFNDDDKLCSSLKLLNNTIKNKLDLIDLHFKYSITGKGAIEAKKDFLERCI